MGKRELVLVVGFVLLGILVYQFTAPPPPPGSDLSVGGLFQRMRRQMHGARDTATGSSTQSVPVGNGITSLRINLSRASDVTITGSDRSDVGIEMRTIARGYSEAEAKAAADAASIKAETTADAVVLSGVWTDLRGPAGYITQATVTITVPQRLAVYLQPHLGRLVLSNVAGAEITSSRGETRISGIRNDLRLTHNGGTLDIADVAALKLTARNSRGTIKDVHGPTTVDAVGGDLTLGGITGPLDIEGRSTGLTLEADTRLQAPLRINMVAGQLRVRGLRIGARIDGRNTDISVALDEPAPVTIYNLGAIAVTAPPGGYDLDAVATEGRITSDDSEITATPDSADAHAAAQVRGGGPPLTLRATRGAIEVRKPAGK
jgi:hypothetical protein